MSNVDLPIVFLNNMFTLAIGRRRKKSARTNNNITLKMNTLPSFQGNKGETH